MVQIDVPAAFVASMLFLDVGSKAIMKEVSKTSESHPAVYYRYLFRSIFFAGLVIAPAGIYLLSGWPGWEQLYVTDRVERPIFEWANALIPALFVGAIVLAAYLGHIVGYRWLIADRAKYIRPTYIIILLAVGILVMLQYPSFLLVGTYQEYHFNRDVMAKVWENPHDFVLGWVIVMAYFAVSFAYVILKIIRENRNLDVIGSTSPSSG